VSRVLVVDDDRGLCDALGAGLGGRGFQVEAVQDPLLALAKLRTDDIDVVLCDVNMPNIDGIELCSRIVAARADVPVVVLTAFGSFDTAVAAIRAGAYDFLSKPVKLDVLAIALERAVQRRALETEVKRLRSEVDRAVAPQGLVGRSAAMRRVHDLLGRVATTDASILITGESGTGKEVVARAIHRASPRASGPFVAINCAALPESLLENELFGHVRGAFTDAREARTGLLRQAEHGTLFLDEIGDMPIGLQPKLLRVLQERVVRPLGGSQEIPIDVRFVTATNRDLEGAIEDRSFREDLYFRINVVAIALPPLRARGSADILALAQHFLTRFAEAHHKEVRGLSAAAADLLVAYSWPGNVRELMNCIEHAVTLATFDQIGPEDLPARVTAARAAAAPQWSLPSELVSLEEMERRYIEHVLESAHGNKAAASRILRIERKTLYRKLQQWGLRQPGETDPE
jgi:DNA-binding NtrC family response regulator